MNDIKLKLEEIRTNLPNTNNDDIYYSIFNAISDNNDLLDYFYDFGIITYKEAEELAKNVLNERGLAGVSSFINDTFNDDFYRINGYENLENVFDTDWEVLIDELIKLLEKE